MGQREKNKSGVQSLQWHLKESQKINFRESESKVLVEEPVMCTVM